MFAIKFNRAKIEDVAKVFSFSTAPVLLLKFTQILKQQLNIILIISTWVTFGLGRSKSNPYSGQIQSKLISPSDPLLFGSTWFHILAVAAAAGFLHTDVIAARSGRSGVHRQIQSKFLFFPCAGSRHPAWISQANPNAVGAHWDALHAKPPAILPMHHVGDPR